MVRYFERKVHNLKRGSWESQTEAAVLNHQLYLIIDDNKEYPDNFGFTKGILGYYISFSIDINEEIMHQLSYYGISSAGIEVISGKYVERLEGFVEGVPTVIPKDEVTSYLKRLISREGSNLSTLEIKKGNSVQVTNFILKKNSICVYGYKNVTTSDLNSGSQDEAISIASHNEYNSSNNIPYIENFIEPKDGKIVFKDGGVFTYFERKVYNLVGSWEEGTLEAIKNKQLFLIINGIRRYPDNDGINRAPKGFYLPFTITVDDAPVKQDESINTRYFNP